MNQSGNSRTRCGAFAAISILLFFSTSVSANPFVGTADSPSVAPVRSGAGTIDAIIRGQLELRNRLARFFQDWERDSSAATLFLILAVSFAYGVLHALGPGHRKTVVFSIYLTRKAPWWEPMASSSILAGLHGGTAIFLILLFKGISGALSSAIEPFALYMEGGAYCVLIVMALVLLVRSAVDLLRRKERASDPATLGTLLLTGVYPCPGAVLVLILSASLDILGIGVLAVVAMSIGMSLPIAFFAYLGWFGRSGLLGRLKNDEDRIKAAGQIIDIVGFAILLVFAVYIALPFLVTIPRLFAHRHGVSAGRLFAAALGAGSF